jgi:hypothetical protein
VGTKVLCIFAWLQPSFNAQIRVSSMLDFFCFFFDIYQQQRSWATVSSQLDLILVADSSYAQPILSADIALENRLLQILLQVCDEMSLQQGEL